MSDMYAKQVLGIHNKMLGIPHIILEVAVVKIALCWKISITPKKKLRDSTGYRGSHQCPPMQTCSLKKRGFSSYLKKTEL